MMYDSQLIVSGLSRCNDLTRLEEGQTYQDTNATNEQCSSQCFPRIAPRFFDIRSPHAWFEFPNTDEECKIDECE